MPAVEMHIKRLVLLGIRIGGAAVQKSTLIVATPHKSAAETVAATKVAMPAAPTPIERLVLQDIVIGGAVPPKATRTVDTPHRCAAGW